MGKAVGQVQGVVGDAQLSGHRPGVLRILKGVAGFSPARGQVLRLKQAQGDAGGFPASCRSSQAATELSTPPLIATAMESCK